MAAALVHISSGKYHSWVLESVDSGGYKKSFDKMELIDRFHLL